jgi:PAS domain S-box-containing protein
MTDREWSAGFNQPDAAFISDILQQLPEAILLIDFDGAFKWMNAEAEKLTGFSIDDTPVFSLAAYLGQPGTLPPALTKVTTAGTTSGWEQLIPNTTTWVKITARAVDDGWLLLLQDITALKKTLQENSSLEQNYRLLVNSIDGIVWEMEASANRFRCVSRHAEKMLGYPVSAWLDGDHFWENHIHPDDREWVVNYCHSRSQVTDYYEFTYRMIAADGRSVWLRDIVSVERIEGQPTVLKGLMIDISKEKRIIEELVKAGELYGLVMKATNDVIWDWELATGNLTWNDNFFSMLGYERSATHQHISFWESCIHPQDRERVVNGIHQAVINRDKIWTAEYRFVKSDGSYVTIFDRGYIILDEHNEPSRMIGSMVNITEQREAQQELEHSYRTIRELSDHLHQVREEERKSIAREIHDELGQQVTVMKMEITWLISEIKSENPLVRQKMEGLLDVLKETVQSIRRISSELRPSLLDDLGLAAAMEWHLKEFERRSGVQTHFDSHIPDTELPDGIRIALFRILQESLTNVARHAQASHVVVNIAYHEGVIAMNITDDGNGMDTSRLKHSKSYGILGMKERAGMMGGNYNIESAPGKGTTISVEVPWEGGRE